MKAVGYLTGASAWTVGENLGWGESHLSTPRQMAAAWMDSPARRGNIRRRRFRRVGIGIALGAPPAGGSGATYTTNLGSRR